jgi:hypothetical protein
VTWTYSGDPTSSDKDEVRALLQDTDDTFPLLSDEEIAWLLGKWGPVYDSNEMVAAVGAAVVARKFAGLVTVQADGVEVDVSGLHDRFVAIAQELRDEYARLQDTGVVDLENLLVGVDVDPSIRPLSFAVGMHDNPQAGLQDFGGWVPQVWNLAFPLLPGADA